MKRLENVFVCALAWSRSTSAYSCSFDMLSQAKRSRISRDKKSEMMTDKDGTRMKLADRYGQF